MAVAAGQQLTAEGPRATTQEIDDWRLGIVGAGKFGTTLARAAVAAGYEVAISGSGPSDKIALTIDVLAPGAHAATTDEVVRHADVIVLAVPTHRFRELQSDLFAGKVLIDATNYWPPVDGDDPELADAARTWTEAEAARHYNMRRKLDVLQDAGHPVVRNSVQADEALRRGQTEPL